MFMIYSNNLNFPHFYGQTVKCNVGVPLTKTFSCLSGKSKFHGTAEGEGVQHFLKFLANIHHLTLEDIL